MSFRESLERHLDVIRNRDTQALADTLSEDLVLVTAEGRLIRGAAEFMALHRDWFAVPDWSLWVKPVEIFEGEDLGVAILHLDYRETGKPSSLSYLTLVFRRDGNRWLMVQDQNTPIRA